MYLPTVVPFPPRSAHLHAPSRRRMAYRSRRAMRYAAKVPCVCQSGNASAELAVRNPPIPAAPQGMEPNCLRQAVSIGRLDANLPFPWLPLPSLPADVGSRPPAVLHKFFLPQSLVNSRGTLVHLSYERLTCKNKRPPFPS